MRSIRLIMLLAVLIVVTTFGCHAQSAHSVSLSWTAPVDLPSGGVYNVYRGTTSGGPYTKLASAVATTTFTDTGVTPGTYYYVVTSVAGGAESGNSNEAKAPVPALPPTPLIIVTIK